MEHHNTEAITTAEQTKLDQWKEARDNAPQDWQLDTYQKNIEEATKLLEDATAEYRIAVVKKACVWGWTAIAKDFGITPKLLHSWHKKYCPEVEDLSEVPAQEKARQEREVRKATRKAEQAARYAEAMELLQKKMEEKKRMIEQINN